MERGLQEQMIRHLKIALRTSEEPGKKEGPRGVSQGSSQCVLGFGGLKTTQDPELRSIIKDNDVISPFLLLNTVVVSSFGPFEGCCLGSPSPLSAEL